MKLENTAERITKLCDVVQNNKKHQYYKRVVKLADTYNTFITGQGLDEKLRCLHTRESEEQHKNRIKITNHVVTAITSTLASPSQKIARSTGITKIYETPNKDKFDDVLDNFYADHDIDYYMTNKVIPKYYKDPNCWQIIEHTGTDGSKLTQPYPFEVSAKEAVYFEKTNSKLDFIIVKNERTISIPTSPTLTAQLPEGASIEYSDSYEEKTQNIYTFYDHFQAIKLVQVFDVKIQKDLQYLEIDGNTYIRLNGNVYLFELPEPYDLSQVPAFVNGYKLDEVTNGETYVNVWHECLPLLEKLVNANSELDISSVLHVFPQKLTYLPRCNYESCNGGYLADNSICPQCKGTGVQNIATSGQDAITLAMPTNKEDLFNLQELVTYVTSMPIDLIKWQAEYIDKVTEYCKRIAFNSDVYSYAEIAKTATGENISMQAIYDTLYPMAIAWVDMWYNFIQTCAELTDMYNDDFIITINVSKDFKLETKEQLIGMLKALRDSKASPAAISEIQKRIISVILQDDNIALQKYEVKEHFYPFSDKTEEDIRLITSSLPMTNEEKILWMFYGTIWDNLEMTYPEIYNFDFKKIKELLNEQINEYKAKLTVTTPQIDLT